MMVREEGRSQGSSPSQSYASGSTTTLFMAVAVLSPLLPAAIAARRFWHYNGAAVRVEQELRIGSKRMTAAAGSKRSMNPKP